MIRRPEQQIEQMERANVRVGYSARRPTEIIEQEYADEKRRAKCTMSGLAKRK